jgi:membrane-associated protease RseP (regulator of RpoE activity)
MAHLGLADHRGVVGDLPRLDADLEIDRFAKQARERSRSPACLLQMTLALYLVAMLGVALLMFVHEAGHYLAARWVGMRVLRFSIGFGPVVWKHQPRNSPTVYQIGLLPFLAYVQIDGMNPYDDNDPNDRASYASARVSARMLAIAAGPLANYVFASVLIFFGLLLGKHGVAEAARLSVVVPPMFVRENLLALARWASGHGHLAVSGPVGLVKAAATQAKMGPGVLLQFLGLLSAAMGAFNLLPFPFLDGGRLLFLGAEAVSSRKADAKIEMWVHAAGLLMLMTFVAFATYGDVMR